jgi:hypothetical protein
MDATQIQGFANQMIQGVMGLQKELEKTMKQGFENMSKEDAQKFSEALKSSGVMEMAKEQTEKIIALNKTKAK